MKLESTITNRTGTNYNTSCADKHDILRKFAGYIYLKLQYEQRKSNLSTVPFKQLILSEIKFQPCPRNCHRSTIKTPKRKANSN